MMKIADSSCQGWQSERATDSLHALLAARTARSFRSMYCESSWRSSRRETIAMYL